MGARRRGAATRADREHDWVERVHRDVHVLQGCGRRVPLADGGTLRHDCYTRQGGAVAFATPARYAQIGKGQTSFSAGGHLTFDKAPNPAEVYGAAAQLSDAHVEVTGTSTRSEDEAFASNAVCGKP